MELLKLRKKKRPTANEVRLEREAHLARQAKKRERGRKREKYFVMFFKSCLFGIALFYCFVIWLKDFIWKNPPMTWGRTFIAVVFDTMEIWFARITNIDTPEEEEEQTSFFDMPEDEEIL